MNTFIIPLGFVFGVMLIHFLYTKVTRRTVTFILKDKGILTKGSVQDGNGCVRTDFMIYTNDGKLLKNVNCLWYWKWHSAEIQAKLQTRKKYSAEIYGVRIGGIDLYPNIIKIREIK